MEWLSIFGLIVVTFIMIPNVIYAAKNKDEKNKCTNKAMNIIEQIGRYGSIFFMIFNIGLFENGFALDEAYVLWLVGTATLILAYWIIWGFYLKKKRTVFALALAIIPSLIFISSGFLMRHWLLLLFGALFSIGHIYVTHKNIAEE